MNAVFVYRSGNVVAASLPLKRMGIESQGLMQKRYAEKPKNPV